MKANTVYKVAGLVAALALFTGCSNSPTSPGTGRLKLFLTDAAADFNEVNIEVTRVEVHSTGADSLGGWAVVNSDTATYDLMTLRNGANALLGDQMLPVGKYTQIRLFLGDNCDVWINGTQYILNVPNHAVILNHEFDIKSGVLYELTLDFDASRSIVQTGNGHYMLDPVIRVEANAISGSISGIVIPVSARALVSTVVGEDTVSAVCDTLTGSFELDVLPMATYNLTITPSNNAYRDTTVTGVQVMAMQNTNIGTIQLSHK